MSNRKASVDWDALLGESSLPADEFTWTDGSNYGMDGYYHTQTMGEGVANRPSLPGASPGGVRDTTMATIGNLPDEMFSNGGPDVSFVDSDPLHIVEDGFDLREMMAESAFHMSAAEEAETKEAAALADLSWLDPTTDQDPTRLPQNVKGNPSIMIPELEQAWGIHRRTDGVSLIPNKDREAEKYYESIKSPPPALPGVRAAAEKFVPAVQRAIRQSHYGTPLKAIAQELVDTLGDSDPRLAMVMQRLAEDHGLAGTVFVNANAFPGLRNGKWVKKLRRTAQSAAFVLTSEDVVAQKLGKVKAAQIHWAKALEFYAPRLTAAGYKLSLGGDPKEVLRRAFLTGPGPVQHQEGFKPVDVRPADTLSATQAFRQMAAAGKSEVEVIASLEGRAIEQKRASQRQRIGSWYRAGKLDQAEAFRLAHSTASFEDVERVLAHLIQMPHERSYDGTHQAPDTQVLRRRALESLASQEAELEAGLRQKFAVQIARQVRAGLLTPEEGKRILAVNKPVRELERIATMAIQQAGQLRRTAMEATPSREYAGAEFRGIPQKVAAFGKLSAFQQKVIAHSETTGVPANEFFSLLKFATREMNEGMAGQNLSAMLGVRFTPELLKAAAPLLNQLRGEHEGLAGSVYVDASAYVSGSGIKGCEAGALKHRTNQVKTVLAMSQCAGCIHNQESFCGIYRKPLIASASEVVGDVKGAQKRLLHMADASDAEVTGSYFSPAEYNLSSPLDNVDLVSQTPTEKLSAILFGGMQLGED